MGILFVTLSAVLVAILLAFATNSVNNTSASIKLHILMEMSDLRLVNKNEVILHSTFFSL